MPITPGECGFTVVAGVTIPTCPPFTAKDCILVNKVYDQCFTEELVTSQIPVSSACPGVTIPAGATVACIPIPGSATCSFAGTVAVTPPLTPYFEEVLVINSFDVSAPILVAGVTVCEPTLTLTGAARGRSVGTARNHRQMRYPGLRRLHLHLARQPDRPAGSARLHRQDLQRTPDNGPRETAGADLRLL